MTKVSFTLLLLLLLDSSNSSDALFHANLRTHRNAIESSSSSSTEDYSCMCSAYDSASSENTNAGTLACIHGFKNLFNLFSQSSDFVETDETTCQDRVDALPTNFCGYPVDPDPWQWVTTMRYLCSDSQTESECALDTYNARTKCIWKSGRSCTWDLTENSCHSDVSDWFATTYSIEESDLHSCSAQTTKNSCENTALIGGHCSSDTLDGEDKNRYCAQWTESSTCALQSFRGERACKWHKKEVQINLDGTTISKCCIAPYSPPAAGSLWCESIDMFYVLDGRIPSGIDGYQCDDLAGKYQLNIHSRDIMLNSSEWQSSVPTIDSHCCVENPPPTVSPTDPNALSGRPSNAPPMRPTMRPTATNIDLTTTRPTTSTIENKPENYKVPTTSPSASPAKQKPQHPSYTANPGDNHSDIPTFSPTWSPLEEEKATAPNVSLSGAPTIPFGIPTKMDCMCAAYNSKATRNDAVSAQCTQGFQDVFDHYATEPFEDFSNAVCKDKLDVLPTNYCGFPNDPEPWESNSPSLCSASSSAGECAFDTYLTDTQCEWSDGLNCQWEEQDQTCSAGITEWFRKSQNMLPKDLNICPRQHTKAACESTVLLGPHCTSKAADGEDSRRVCAAVQDESTCGNTSFRGLRACTWYEKDFGRDTTFEGCCDLPYTPPYSGSRWCEAVGASYVQDGRITVQGTNSTCDELTAYKFRVQSRATAEVHPELKLLVPSIDATCCISTEPTLSSRPTFSPSKTITDKPSSLPTESPPSSIPKPSSLSKSPMSAPTDATSQSPVATPTRAPSSSPIINNEEVHLSSRPTTSPSKTVTDNPNTLRTESPTSSIPNPSLSKSPVSSPTDALSQSPVTISTRAPSSSPIIKNEEVDLSSRPTFSPSRTITDKPSSLPTESPTSSIPNPSSLSKSPMSAPTNATSQSPVATPTRAPSSSPIIKNEEEVPTQKTPKSFSPSSKPSLFKPTTQNSESNTTFEPSFQPSSPETTTVSSSERNKPTVSTTAAAASPMFPPTTSVQQSDNNIENNGDSNNNGSDSVREETTTIKADEAKGDEITTQPLTSNSALVVISIASLAIVVAGSLLLYSRVRKSSSTRVPQEVVT